MNRFRNVVLRKCKSLSRVGRPSASSYSNLRSMSTREDDAEAAEAGAVDADDTAAAESPVVGGSDRGAVVFVGSSRRRYVIRAEHLNHPLVTALIDDGRKKQIDPTIAVVNCEVVLFDHLLWMLDNAAVDLHGDDDDAMRELAQLYAS